MYIRLPLYFHSNVYNITGTKRYFQKCMLDNFHYHLRHNPTYRRMVEYDCKRKGIKKLQHVQKLDQIPPLPTALFKQERLWTLPRYHMAVQASSSGTSGTRSQIGYDWGSLPLAAAMALGLGKHHQLFSKIPTRYLMLGYEPHRGNPAMIVKTQGITSLFAPPARHLYALRWKKGGYTLDLDGLVAGLQQYSKGKLPVRLIGFPSYLYFLLLELKKAGKTYKLPSGSMVLMGGGWKEFSGIKVEIEALFSLCQEVLGLKETQVREFFGAAEHPVFYCTCKNHHFHVPIYGRVIIRDVSTLNPLGYGKIGLLNLLSPLAKSMPLLSVMTDDLAILHPGKSCGCGIESPYFEILGRAGLEEIMTCAATAGKLLSSPRAEST